jgi:membrane-anchored protein YejM (alkaline phosphatase superfamily)
MGAWVNYGLGSECQNLPGFVAINGGLIPPGGLDCFGSGFLPASYQGSVFKPAGSAVANIQPQEGSDQQQRDKLALIEQLDQRTLVRYGEHDSLESAIRNYELAYQMQMAVPDLMDLSDETQATRDLYGLDAPYKPTQIYAAECLIARRLIERGVRFVELTCPAVGGDRWDQHSNLREGHENNAKAVDQPIAGLLRDLRRRGLLDETLVVWAGEFGRTPFAQGTDGRDHNPFGFTIWMAGGGVKAGTIYGATDEFGYKAIENRVEIHDLHATMLHLLGVDHTRSTFRFGGRDMRLTDVKGHVLHDLVA